jgi:putative glutamine amidotransferase
MREGADAHGAPVDALERAYVEYLAGLGLEAVPLPNRAASVEALLPALSPAALVLTGGGDLFAGAYDDPSHPSGTQPRRDGAERAAASWALGAGVPVLGVCRGMQFLNALMGGYVSRVPESAGRPPGRDHEVVLAGGRGRAAVNSFHGDCVTDAGLAPGLVALARDGEAGAVEALASADGLVLGLQWHPERPFSDPAGRELSDALVAGFLGRNVKGWEGR